jgi:hypothetical protein
MKLKVRIAVAYTADGQWNACGFSEGVAWKGNTGDENLIGGAAAYLSDAGHEPLGHHFVEAEIEIPDPVPPQTVEGTVSK